VFITFIFVMIFEERKHASAPGRREFTVSRKGNDVGRTSKYYSHNPRSIKILEFLVGKQSDTLYYTPTNT
jgi:hypothetical protein